MLVKEIMVPDLVSIRSDSSVLMACQLYKERKVGCVVVIDDNRCVGMVTERDLIERCLCMRCDPEVMLVRDIMSRDVKTVHKLDSVDKAIEMMRSHGIKKLPVRGDSGIVGIVTMTDIAYARPDLSERFVDSWIKPRWG